MTASLTADLNTAPASSPRRIRLRVRSPRAPRPLGARRISTPRRPTRPAGPPSSAGDASSVLSSAFTMLAIVCLWMAAQMLFLGTLSQHRAQDLLYGEFRTQLASATAPLGPIVPVGDPVAIVTAESIGLQQVVVEGTASGDLLVGPGHRRDTVLPGQEGTSVVYGRAATYGAPFGHLAALRAGDRINIVMAQGELTFVVDGVRRAGDPLPQPVPAGSARLTLVAAEGSGRLSALAPKSAIYVDATSTKAFPAPPGRPAAVPESEKAMATDQGALPLLALCLALLLALTLGVIAARQRWSTALVWVLASPVAIALSWASTDVVMRLLPNLI
ncbi:MAG: peptidase sortase [Nocardioides sp.]|nr:peptidase sortase [Nocardioides sp.]